MQLVGFICLYERSSQDDPSNKVRHVYLKQQHIRIIIMCVLVRSHNDIVKFHLWMGRYKLSILNCHHYFTVFSPQDSLLHQQDSLWTPASLWNFEFSQSTFGNLNQQRSIVQSYTCKQSPGAIKAPTGTQLTCGGMTVKPGSKAGGNSLSSVTSTVIGSPESMKRISTTLLSYVTVI